MVQAEKIRAHREELGLSVKEMSDAIGLGKEGDKLWRKWEAGDEKLPKSQYEKIMNFATYTPYRNEIEDPCFRYIDLFAGIGGIRIPFQELGGKCVFTSEWDPFAQKTYKINFGGEIAGDITEVDEKPFQILTYFLEDFLVNHFLRQVCIRDFRIQGERFFLILNVLLVKKDRKPSFLKT